MMRRCDGNESEVGVGVGQEPAVEVGVGTASPRLRNSDRGPEGSGVGDRVALSHGNESGVGVGFGATTTLRPCFLPYTRLLRIVCFFPSASYHPLPTKRRVSTPREMRLHGGFFAQVRSLLLGYPYAEMNKDLFCQKA